MAINRKPDRWRTDVREEVARLTGRSFERFATRPMFSLTNSPQWVEFLNAAYDKGVTPKRAAKEFVAGFLDTHPETL